MFRESGLGVRRKCRNLIKKPWPYDPQNSRIHIRNPNKGPRFLNQVPTLAFKGITRVPLQGSIRVLQGFLERDL